MTPCDVFSADPEAQAAPEADVGEGEALTEGESRPAHVEAPPDH